MDVSKHSVILQEYSRVMTSTNAGSENTLKQQDILLNNFYKIFCIYFVFVYLP